MSLSLGLEQSCGMSFNFVRSNPFIPCIPTNRDKGRSITLKTVRIRSVSLSCNDIFTMYRSLDEFMISPYDSINSISCPVSSYAIVNTLFHRLDFAFVLESL